MANSKPIWVPMKLDAYTNWGPQKTNTSDPRQQAYLAPFNDPNFQGLQVDTGTLQNDIFEHHESAPYMGNADRYRKLPSRQGIYLHWSVPKMYRVGLTASDSDDSRATMAQKVQQGGYPHSQPAAGQPLFRPLPNRWFVWRTVRPLGAQDNLRMKDRATGIESQVTSFDSGYADGPCVRDCFMVESDCIRSITDTTAIPPAEDVEVSCTPFLDPTTPLSEQGLKRFGKTSWINASQWSGNDNSPPQNPVRITVARSGNPYFPDFQPHNSSVLSFFDDLSVRGKNAVFSQGSVSYTVVGYHTLNQDDPLCMNMNYDKGQTAQSRLDACSLSITNQLNADDTNYLKTPLSTTTPTMRTLVHGNMFNLSWSNSNTEEPALTSIVNPGDTIQRAFTDSHPVSVGTNPIDALFGWLRSTDSNTGSQTTDQIKQTLLKLQTLVLDYNDNVDSQLSAEDLLATNNFVPSAGGSYWHFQSPDESQNLKQPLVPTTQQIKDLRQLNLLQARLNAILREQQRLKCELFCAWWTYVCDKNSSETRNSAFNTAINVVPNLQTAIKANADYTNNNVGNIATLGAAIEAQKAKLGQLQTGQQPSFYVQRDPTLFIAGLKSQWPTDWDQPRTVRLHPENFLSGGQAMGFPQYPRFKPSDMPTSLPTYFADPISKILSEAEYGYINQAPFQQRAPYFGTDNQNGRNGWFPLFVEWEAEYYHIPFDQWTFGPRGADARYSYGLRADANPADPTIQGDYRLLKGRCPILPQAGSVLAATLKQIFAKDPNNPMSASDRDNLIAKSSALDFLSSPMQGVTDQLITCVQGLHTLPVQNTSNGVTIVANAPGSNIGFRTPADFQVMLGATSRTPFASAVDMPADKTKYSPFKPCIHGQMRFTKLNIIDKFGQIVQGVQLTSSIAKSVGPYSTPLFPCLGESYSVDYSSDKTTPKIVLPRQNGDSKCPFVQLPPSINQNARVNAHFLKEDTPPTWRYVDEWENPVRGWFVVNQANRSLQVFTTDGRFVREYAVDSQFPFKRPFAEDQTLMNTLDPVLKGFLANFSRPGYLQGLFRTVTEAIESVQAAPSSYGESMLSVLGRPIALTAFGVNLELADPPKYNMSTVATKAPPLSLLNYNFGLKIGDKDNVYDGLYGFFTTSTDVSKGVDVNWNDFYSYHSPADEGGTPITGDPSRAMPDDTTISPFYPDPHTGDINDPVPYSLARMQKLVSYVALVDPFTPVNLYTALLPIQQLTVPSWVIDSGVKEISSFFKMGPLLVPTDVPTYDSSKAVTQDYRLDDADLAPKTTGTLPIPSVGLGDWAWLQPYWANGQTNYNLLDVSDADDKPGWQDAPYTAVEGFLQQKKPFTSLK